MPRRFAVATALLLVRTEMVEGDSREELEAELHRRLKRDGVEEWRLEQFEMASSTLQIVEVAVPDQIIPETTSAA